MITELQIIVSINLQYDTKGEKTKTKKRKRKSKEKKAPLSTLVNIVNNGAFIA
jgi:cell division protein ZapA (FtsZ GTPase activity inhibitor)